MPFTRLLAALAMGLVLPGCLLVLPVPVLSDPPAPSATVQINGRTLTLRRSAETFPVAIPANSLTQQGIALTPAQPLPVRGQGEPAVVVGGTTLGEWTLAEDAVRSVCGIAPGGDAAAGFDTARRAYDADAAEALYPLVTCPQLSL